MAEIERPSDDVLILHLSPYHSLDLVRVPHTQKYRIVFAERWGVQRRAFVEVTFEEAGAIAKFLGACDTDVALISDPSPSTRTPAIDAAVLPPIPPRTRTRGT